MLRSVSGLEEEMLSVSMAVRLIAEGEFPQTFVAEYTLDVNRD